MKAIARNLPLGSLSDFFSNAAQKMLSLFKKDEKVYDVDELIQDLDNYKNSLDYIPEEYEVMD